MNRFLDLKIVSRKIHYVKWLDCSYKYIYFLFFRKLTLTDGIERCLKKGRGLEQAAAAQLATLLCVQLGSGDMTDEVCRDLSPLLTFIVNDHSMSLPARSKVYHYFYRKIVSLVKY